MFTTSIPILLVENSQFFLFYVQYILHGFTGVLLCVPLTAKCVYLVIAHDGFQNCIFHNDCFDCRGASVDWHQALLHFSDGCNFSRGIIFADFVAA